MKQNRTVIFTRSLRYASYSGHMDLVFRPKLNLVFTEWLWYILNNLYFVQNSNCPKWIFDTLHKLYFDFPIHCSRSYAALIHYIGTTASGTQHTSSHLKRLGTISLHFRCRFTSPFPFPFSYAWIKSLLTRLTKLWRRVGNRQRLYT